MITIAEVIETCAKLCESTYEGAFEGTRPCFDTPTECAAAIRALAAQYEGCIVAEGEPTVLMFKDEDGRDTIMAADSHPYFVDVVQATPLYRAKEPTK